MPYLTETTLENTGKIEALRAAQLESQNRLQQLCRTRQKEPAADYPAAMKNHHCSLYARIMLCLLIFVIVLFMDGRKIKIAEIQSKQIFELISADYTSEIQKWLRSNLYYRPIK